jgi:hypothetical protein
MIGEESWRIENNPRPRNAAWTTSRSAILPARVARPSGSKGEEGQHGVRDMGSVGRDEPDQSKERNTEIAVEAGRKGPEHRDDKR